MATRAPVSSMSFLRCVPAARRAHLNLAVLSSLTLSASACAMQVDSDFGLEEAQDLAEATDDVDVDVDVEGTQQAIERGWVDTGDPAVGLVLSDGAFCTGTLIGESIVLTAAHCLDDGAVHSFYTGTGSPSPTAWPTGLVHHAVDNQIAHPSYNRYGNAEDGNSGFDIALLHLRHPICGAKTWSIKRTAPEVDSTCVAIGFGEHTENGLLSYSLKRACTETLTGVFAQSLGLKGLTGYTAGGDSGGPILCDWGGIAGVVSAHRTHDVERSYAARVDPVADWIDTASASLRRPLERLSCIRMIECRFCKDRIFRQ